MDFLIYLVVSLAATIRLAPLLPTTVAVSGFPSIELAVQAAGEIIKSGVPVRESARISVWL